MEKQSKNLELKLNRGKAMIYRKARIVIEVQARFPKSLEWNIKYGTLFLLSV